MILTSVSPNSGICAVKGNFLGYWRMSSTQLWVRVCPSPIVNRR